MSHNARIPAQFASRWRAVLVVGSILIVLLLVLAYATERVVRTRTWQVAGDLVSRVETRERVVALTFDDGPTDADADAVLDVLADRGVKATFYVNGKDIEGNDATMLRLIEDGHELGNHTWSHRSMVLVSPRTVAYEIESTDDAIRRSGYDGPITFRPPYGKKLVTLPRYLAEHDRLTVTWDVGYEEWSDAPQSSEQLVRDTVAGTRPGSIILLHPWFGRTATQDAIGPVIDQLRAQGYEFVTVSELVG